MTKKKNPPRFKKIIGGKKKKNPMDGAVHDTATMLEELMEKGRRKKRIKIVVET